METREQIHEKMLEYFSNNKNALRKYIEFHDHYGTGSNCDGLYMEKYGNVYKKLGIDYSSAKNEIGINGSTHLTSDNIKINENIHIELLRKIENNTNRSSQWIRFIGIVLLVILIWLFISAIVTSI